MGFKKISKSLLKIQKNSSKISKKFCQNFEKLFQNYDMNKILFYRFLLRNGTTSTTPNGYAISTKAALKFSLADDFISYFFRC